MKCSAERKCRHCKELYLLDRWIDVIFSTSGTAQEPACRKQSKVESQIRWVQKPDNQNYFVGRKIASGSRNGENTIRDTGAKRSLLPKNRYKIIARLKWLRMRKLKE